MHIAQNTWSEFFADMVAYPYFAGTQFDKSVELTNNVLRSAQDDAAFAVARYRISGDAGKLWRIVTQIISGLFCQVGRALGQASAAEEAGQNGRQQFYAAFSDLSDKWKHLLERIEQACAEMSKLPTLSRTHFESLEECVMDALALICIRPELGKQGLWIGVGGPQFP